MKLIALTALALISTGAFAQTRVKGYEKKDGTYVAPSERTKSNKTELDNYSTKGNYNPYTGKEGTKTPKEEKPKTYNPYQ